MNLFKKIIGDIFYISLLTWVIYFILELLREGLISDYFDLNLLLFSVIGFGILNIIFNAEGAKEEIS